MNIFLSRILIYLNGAVKADSNYKICKFIVTNYPGVGQYSEDQFLEKGGFTKAELDEFINDFNFISYSDFTALLLQHHQTRLDQIEVRMVSVSYDQLISKMDKKGNNAEMKREINSICKKINKAKRLFVIGAYYPDSIASELQTDMITFGKPFYEYNTFDKPVMNKDDLVFFVSATGRALNGFKKNNANVHLEEAQTILITQNMDFLISEATRNCHVLFVPGKFDSINFNYQIMTIFDLIRINYYKQYVY